MKRVSCTGGWWFGVVGLACHAETAGPAMSTTTETTREPDDGADTHVDTPTTSSAGSIGETSTGTTVAGETSVGDGSGGVSTGEAPPGTCGDGVEDLGEDCDLGYGSNSDAGACTQSCQQATCGDGLLWIGEEQCDAGGANNDETYGGCREDCTLGPRCDDGVLQLDDEECDAAAPAAEGAAPCDASTCRFAARLVFVTSATFTGALGGVKGADAICVTAAKAAGLDNASSFRAWLSDGVFGPSVRFNNGPKADAYPYARRDGKQLAASFQSLTTYGPNYAIDVDEFGVQLPPEQYAWTATNPKGMPYMQGDACGQWTSQDVKYSGRVGQISPEVDGYAEWHAGDHWTSYTNAPCFFVEPHLYCFED